MPREATACETQKQENCCDPRSKQAHHQIIPRRPRWPGGLLSLGGIGGHCRVHFRRVLLGVILPCRALIFPAKKVAGAAPLGRLGDALYQLTFVGGPSDGYRTQSAEVPAPRLLLRSGPAGCGTRSGTVITPRLAEYCLAGATLIARLDAPAVLCRFQYVGTVPATAEPRHRRLWNQLSRLLATLTVATRPHHTPRSLNHVQG